MLNDLAKETYVARLARAVLLVGTAPGQSAAASALVARLLAAVPVRAAGVLVLPAAVAEDREARALVLAAIAGTTPAWPADQQALAGKLWARLYLERGVHGGYGSAEATRAVVTTLPPGLEAARLHGSIRWQ